MIKWTRNNARLSLFADFSQKFTMPNCLPFWRIWTRWMAINTHAFSFCITHADRQTNKQTDPNALPTCSSAGARVIIPRKTRINTSFQRSTIYFAIIHFVFNDENQKCTIKTNCKMVTFRHIYVTNRCDSNARTYGIAKYLLGATNTVEPHYYSQLQDRA